MEADGQRYSVLTRTEVREKMIKEIDQISEVFSLSKSDATLILIHLRWNTFKASDVLGDNKEKFLVELGLVQDFGSDPNESNSSSAAESNEKVLSHGGGRNLVSTPFCPHKFSKISWSKYLRESLKKKKEEMDRGLISCLNQDCAAPVGPDTIEKLSKRAKEMYERYVLGLFVEGNKGSIKWCPATGCGYAIEIHEVMEDDSGVVCLCGHIFCWKCQLESHRPVTCEDASRWSTELLDELRSVSWISANTKRCPNCNMPVQHNGDPDFRLIICVCSWRFCWICLCSEEQHNGNWDRHGVFLPPPENNKMVVESRSNQLNQVLHLKLWDAGHAEMERAKFNLKAMEQNTIPKLTNDCGLSQQDIKALRQASMLIVQCKQVLKWSYVYDFFINKKQIAKKQYLNHLLDEAREMINTHEKTLDKVLQSRALSPSDFDGLRFTVEAYTTTTANFYHDFVKTLEDGMPEVKDETSENASSDNNNTNASV